LTRRRLLLLAVASIVVVVIGWWRSTQEPVLNPVAAAEVILGTVLPKLNGKPQSIGQWRGQVLVVNFWATWCEPCRDEIPALNKLYDQYRARDVQFIGIAVDDQDKVASYVRTVRINYPLLIGGADAMELARRVGDRKSVLPFTLVVDKTEKIALFQAGVIHSEKLEGLLKSLP